LKVCHLTDPGTKKEVNEDSLYADEGLGLFIVADGMSGHNAGGVASTLAVDAIAQAVRKGLQANRDTVELLREAIAAANKSIFEKSHAKPEWADMGTTVVAALASGRDLVIGHVGDSRAYLIGDGEIKQLTEDHTFVAEWVKEGHITKHQARSHPQRHGLTAALGVADEVEIDVAIWAWDGKHCLLLCSDGLTEMLRDKEILEIVESSEDHQAVCRNLISAAQEKGARDNVSVVLVCK
jgi:protein phosphatase